MATATPSTGTLPDWDADSPTLKGNLAVVDQKIHADAAARVPPSFEDARDWHSAMMAGLNPGPDPMVVGNFRGETGLESCRVGVGKFVSGKPVGPVQMGTDPSLVGAELQKFEDELQAQLKPLDKKYPTAASLDRAGVGKVIHVAAWAHSEWVRIHPFANGNGRTARMWANLVLLRYGAPPVMRLRPRPDGRDEVEYANAGKAGMKRDQVPARVYIRRKIDEETKSAKTVAAQKALTSTAAATNKARAKSTGKKTS